MKPSLRSVLVLVLSTVAGGFVRGADAPPPDAVYVGGKVITVDNAFAIREAFAVKDGRIVAVGESGTIRALARSGVTQVHELRGRVVMPGLIDSHVHATSASMTEFEHPIPDMETIADVLAFIRERAKVVPEGEWISLSQIFITRLREMRFPTRAELDAAAPKHPVAFHTGPDVMLSSLALKLNGIDRNFEVTDGREGYMEKDSSGEPTGVLRGLGRFVKKSPSSRTVKVTDADRLGRLRDLFRDYNRVGLTAIADRGANAQSIPLYEGMLARGELTLRVALSHTIPTAGSHESIMKAIDGIGAHRLRAPNPWLRIIGTKMWLDGGMLTGSAYMLKPWGRSEIYGIRDEKYLGVLNVSPEQLLPLVRQVAKNGMQFTAHVQGDGAVTTLVDTYEKVNAEIPVKPLRMGLTHSSFMTAEVLPRIARLGIVPDIQPIWLYLDARTLVQHFGYDRLRYFQPLRSLVAAGGIAGGGSDHMQKIGDLRAINSYNPFWGMWITVSRGARWLDRPLHPEEALTRADAIRFYTRNNAHLLFWEQEIGAIEPGKRADFIVVDRDPLECPLDDLKDTKVLQTWIEGRLVHGQVSD